MIQIGPCGIVPGIVRCWLRMTTNKIMISFHFRIFPRRRLPVRSSGTSLVDQASVQTEEGPRQTSSAGWSGRAGGHSGPGLHFGHLFSIFSYKWVCNSLGEQILGSIKQLWHSKSSFQFLLALLCYIEIKHYNWLKLITWLATGSLIFDIGFHFFSIEAICISRTAVSLWGQIPLNCTYHKLYTLGNYAFYKKHFPCKTHFSIVKLVTQC